MKNIFVLLLKTPLLNIDSVINKEQTIMIWPVRIVDDMISTEN